MSEIARLYRYRSLLSGRGAVSTAKLMAELEISHATFKRDIAKLRDQLHVPIVFDRDFGGYRLEQGHTDSELPGLWFSQDEILALLTIQNMLSQLEPGLLGPKLKPLQQRLAGMLEKQGLSEADMARHIRLLYAGKRKVPLKSFQAVAAGTLARKQLLITHLNRQSGSKLVRTVSPQQLVHYRDNWYLDGWCHLRNDLRSFAVDAIEHCDIQAEPAHIVEPEHLRRVMQSSYGIFSGAPKAWAELKFTPERARWVSGEQWHPDQRSHESVDGSFVLEVPYSDERELLGDILRFGADVEVLGPPDLRARVRKALHDAAGRYI